MGVVFLVASIPLLARHGNRFRQAEVRDHGVTAVEQDVRRLHIAVHHAVCVRVRQRVGNLPDDRYHVGERQPPLALEPLLQRLAVDERHREVHEPVRRLARGEQGNDVGVAKGGRHPRLAVEALDAQHRAQLRGEDLHYHAPAELRFGGKEHTAHATAGELALDAERRT